MIRGLYDFAKKWSEKGSVWLFSDPHFGDSDCKIMNSNWPSPTEQVNILKSKCHKNDTLVILGDVGDPSYLEDIKAYLVLVAGNHDKGMSMYSKYFDEVYKGILTISDRIVLSHEPIYISAKRDYNTPFMLNIHGHCHNGAKGFAGDQYHLNVAADVVDYTPVNLGKIIKAGAVSTIKTIHRHTIDDDRAIASISENTNR